MSETLRPASRAETPAAQSAVLRERAAILALVIGLGVSALAAFFVHAREHDKAVADFAQRTQAFANLASDRLQRHQESLYSLRNLFHYSGDVTREEFAGAARDLISRQVGVQAIEWIVRVPAAERARVEAAVRAEGFPGFEFTERASPSTLRPAAARPRISGALHRALLRERTRPRLRSRLGHHLGPPRGTGGHRRTRRVRPTAAPR